MFFAIGFQANLLAQTSIVTSTGEVTYSTSSNVYVRFANTNAIQVGDTLFCSTQIPCLVVNAKSSSTCVASIIGSATIAKGQKVLHYSKKNEEEQKPITIATKVDTIQPAPSSDTLSPVKKEHAIVRGRITLANYSNFGLSTQTSNHRQFAAFQLNAKNIASQRISVDVYANYSLISPSLPSKELATKNLFRLFRANINYEFKSGGFVSLGRKYNSKLASLGSLDGLQFEKEFNNFYVGAIAGFRPDLFNFSFNPDLFQYGIYAGYLTQNSEYSSTTTLGFVEQYNKGALDRRFATIQHNGNLGKLNFFVSSEMELYNPTFNKMRLSSFFISTRYRITKKATAFISYDARKAIIYYQSDYQNMQTLEDDISRGGLRIRFNYNFTPKIFTGISANYRFQNDGANKSANYYGYVRMNQLPGIGGALTVACGLNFSNSLNSLIPSARYSHQFFNQKLDAYIFYRYQKYNYAKYETVTVSNNFYGAGSFIKITNKLRLNIFGEFSSTSTGEYVRFNLSISQQF